jgi:alkylation response protein AidB-like acyl-CoA dehydrogenase
MDELLRFLLTTPPTPEPLGSLEDWWTWHLRLSARFETPVDLACAAGFSVERLGHAFASGYQAALRSLLPGLAREHRAALCITESGGGHPGAMHTRLARTEAGALLLSGEKTFVTLGTAADVLLVAASEGQDAQGRNRLRLVRLEARRPEVELTALPPMPFVPEVPHAVLRLREVPVTEEAVLPGDGYTRYIKPFRTVEDCHVYAAVLGWLLRVARRAGWPEAVQDELLSLVVTLRALALADAASPAVHLALGGTLDVARRLVDGLAPHWERVDAPTRERWERDRPLLGIAGKVRAKRREAARQRLAALPSSEEPAGG